MRGLKENQTNLSRVKSPYSGTTTLKFAPQQKSTLPFLTPLVPTIWKAALCLQNCLPLPIYIVPCSAGSPYAQTWSRHLPTSYLSGIITYDSQYTALLVMFAFPQQGSSHPQSLDAAQWCFLWEQPTRSALLQDASIRHCRKLSFIHSFMAENLPVLTRPAKSFLPDFAHEIPFSAEGLWTGLQSTLLCEFNETLQVLPWI